MEVEESTEAEVAEQAERETLRNNLHSLCREDSESTLHQDHRRRKRHRWQTLDESLHKCCYTTLAVASVEAMEEEEREAVTVEEVMAEAVKAGGVTAEGELAEEKGED